MAEFCRLAWNWLVVGLRYLKDILGSGVGDLVNLGEIAAEAWRNDRNGRCPLPAGEHFVTLALVPQPPHGEFPPLSFSDHSFSNGSFSDTILVAEQHFPAGLPGMAVRCQIRCRIHPDMRDLSRLRRQLNRDVNHRRSGGVIAGMVLLLATCGWIIGGDDGARWALNAGTPMPGGPLPSPGMMLGRFGARLLRPADLPELFGIVMDLCGRADLPRLPDLYYLPGFDSMNAYALGGPEGSAIALTEGLLRRMSLSEIAGILAHEIAHIRNNDAWAMSWAGVLHSAIALTSMAGLASLQRQHGVTSAAGGALAALLNSASAIGQLLRLALSRIRELDADAVALDLTDDPQALVSALHKLEHHHAGSRSKPPTSLQDGLMRLLHSHPATSERVGILMGLAAPA
jgi:heat shock protein HtpX